MGLVAARGLLRRRLGVDGHGLEVDHGVGEKQGLEQPLVHRQRRGVLFEEGDLRIVVQDILRRQKVVIAFVLRGEGLAVGLRQAEEREVGHAQIHRAAGADAVDIVVQQPVVVAQRLRAHGEVEAALSRCGLIVEGVRLMAGAEVAEIEGLRHMAVFVRVLRREPSDVEGVDPRRERGQEQQIGNQRFEKASHDHQN